MTRDNTLNAIIRGLYTSPAEEELRRDAPWFYLINDFTISELELKKMAGGERAFVAVIAARIRGAIGGMSDYLWASLTFPVHDEPGLEK